MKFRFSLTFAAMALVIAGCGKAGDTDAPVSEAPVEIAVPVEPELPVLPPMHPALEENQAFLIDFTKQTIADGWYIANHDLPDGQWKNDFRASSVTFSDEGMDLSIQLKKDWQPDNWFWDASEVSTDSTFHYGYYEVEMKIAQGSGLVSSLFTYTGPFYGTAHDEVDIEFVGNRTDHVEFNVFHDGSAHGSKRHELGFDASEAFHTYGFDWQADYVHWYVDGELVHRLEDPAKIPNLPSKIMMNMWTGNIPQWHGPADFNPGAKAQYRCLSYGPNRQDAPSCFGRD